MGCPFIDKRYGQNFCDATDGYIEWQNYCDICNNSYAYEACANYKNENNKRKNSYFKSSYLIK